MFASHPAKDRSFRKSGRSSDVFRIDAIDRW
jgi:hypothetical protein